MFLISSTISSGYFSIGLSVRYLGNEEQNSIEAEKQRRRKQGGLSDEQPKNVKQVPPVERLNYFQSLR